MYLKTSISSNEAKNAGFSTSFKTKLLRHPKGHVKDGFMLLLFLQWGVSDVKQEAP